MKATKKLFQVFLVQNEKSKPSRYFENESRAEDYCRQYNQILDKAISKAVYQEVQLEPKTDGYRILGASEN